MKNQIPIVLLMMFALVVSGCAPTSTPTSPAAPAEPLATESPAVQEKASLISALQASGATVETGEPISQAFFTPKGSIIKVNGVDVQVFEYESSEQMENETSQVAPDGAQSSASTRASLQGTIRIVSSV